MDPITLLAAASAAFNGVKKLIDHGREIEDVFGQLSKWASYTSDLQEWCKQEEAKPSIFKKLSFKDDTSEALNVMSIRMKLAQQEKDIREMFQWYGPPDAYEEFIKERRKIKAQREKMIYEQARRRKEFMYLMFNLSLIGLSTGFLAWFGWFMYMLVQNRGL
jgi:hypothetical protein